MLTPAVNLPLERECRITLGEASRNVSAGQNIMSSLPSSPLTGGASAPMVAARSTIKFGQAVIQPVTFMQPGPDHPFFKKPASTPVSMPQKGWGTPDAHSSPLLKESCASPEGTPDLTKSSAEQLVVIEDMVGDDDEDEAPAPDRSVLLNVKSARESSKQWESPPVKKAQTEDLEAHKPRSRKMSHASRDERGKREGSNKGPEYKQM